MTSKEQKTRANYETKTRDVKKFNQMVIWHIYELREKIT